MGVCEMGSPEFELALAPSVAEAGLKLQTLLLLPPENAGVTGCTIRPRPAVSHLLTIRLHLGRFNYSWLFYN